MPYYKTKSSNRSFWSWLPLITLPNNAHLENFLKTLPAEAQIVDIGSGGRFISPNIITLDKFIADNTKVIGDIHNLPFKSESIDCIICTGTLEHVENPWRAVDEFGRVLKTGGVVYIGTPFMQGYHPDPADYWRFTEEGLIRLFEGFTRIDSGPLMGSGSGLSWALNDFFRAISDNKYISDSLGIVARFLFFWVKYCDRFLRGKNNSLFASGFYFTGRKTK
jgi:SAM-dependent methyltransferase